MPRTSSDDLSIRAKLVDAVNTIDRPGTVCTGGDLPLTMPGLEVKGLGEKGMEQVRLPLGKTQARTLIKLCRQASYGKGTETLIDTDVRRVWELDPEEFALSNPKWDELVPKILRDVQAALGLENRRLTAHLYKLLLYEEGGFFLPHQDGEKLDRMVATLIIGIPSVHAGGKLIVSHDGEQYEFAFTGAASGHELSYAAFYSDCRHEVRPLRSGYRLCLVYNVTLAKSRGKKGIAAPTSGAAIAAIHKLLGDWRDGAETPKLAITLDHEYTRDGLTLDKLKGVDRARAEILFEAAEQAGCDAHLALVTLWQNGAAEGDWDAHWYGRRGGYRDDDGQHEMGEIYDSSLSCNDWSNREGEKVAFGEIPLEDEEIVTDKALAEWKVSDEEFEGYTGNAGMTLERWYHRAAVVVWPRENRFYVLCDAGTDAAIAGLQTMVDRLQRVVKANREPHRQSCLEFAAAIIDSWRRADFVYSSNFPERSENNRAVCLPLLLKLNDPAIVRRFLVQVMINDEQPQLDKSFSAFCRRHGWPTFADELAAVIDASSAATIQRNSSLLRTLCLHRDKNAERVELCRLLATRIVTALEFVDEQSEQHDWRRPKLDRAGMLSSLVRAMAAVDAAEPLDRLIEYTLSRCRKYDLTDTHLAAIFDLESWLKRSQTEPNRAISNWLTECRKALESRTAKPPAKPTNQRRPSKLSCDCEDCRELRRFLDDPNEAVHRFRVRKDRRKHLHQIIERNKCDLTHATDRNGSPQTLVCTKTTASYEADCRIDQRDKKNLARLKQLAVKCGQLR